MHPRDAQLLEELRSEQERLHKQMLVLDRRIGELGVRIVEEAKAPVAPPVAKPVFDAPAAVLIPPPLPPVAEVAVQPREVHQPLPPAAIEQEIVSPPVAPPAKDGWELQLGTVWFARIGIVVLITGLVFLGNYAWQHVVTRLGAGGKLALLFGAGVLLAALGRWLERRTEATRNFGHVLVAGGAAVIYYSAYAAHFVRQLKVVESPLVGGGLLLLLAVGFIVWADRQKSQTVAVLAIVFAYYTSAINPIGNFTLFSSLLLTAGAVWLLLRHQWDTLGWASLAGTYGSFTYWRIVHPARSAHWSTGVAFVAGYWVLFTGAALLQRADRMPEARRTAFLTLNNAAFFALVAWRLLSLEQTYFGWFAMGFGAVLLGLSRVAYLRIATQPKVERALLAQGLLLVTAGFIATFTGAQLALLLAVQSALLLSAANWRHSAIFQVFALLCAAGAWVAAWLHGGTLVPSGVGAILVFDAWWLRAQLPQLRERVLDARAALFSGGAVSLFVPALIVALPSGDRPGAWAALALIGTASVYLLRVPELAWATQIVLAGEIVRQFIQPGNTAAWHTLPPLAAALALCHWWQRQTVLKLPAKMPSVLELTWAIGFALLGVAWLNGRFTGDDWMLASSGAGAAMLLYGLLTRSWALAVAGQIFAVLAVGTFLERMSGGSATWYAALAPIGLLALTAVVLRFVESRIREGGMRPQAAKAATLYRLAAYLLFALWLHAFVPSDWLPLAFVVTGALVLLASRMLPRESSHIGSSFLLTGLLIFAVLSWGARSWADLLAIVLASLALRAAARLTPDAAPEWRRPILILAVGCLWLWVTRWTISHGGSGGLTVAWSILALIVFGTGLALRERIYRLGGFTFLALAVGRVFLVDVWRLETLARILSFLVLGAVLLVLGFVYNRYAEQIRRLL